MRPLSVSISTGYNGLEFNHIIEAAVAPPPDCITSGRRIDCRGQLAIVESRMGRRSCRRGGGGCSCCRGSSCRRCVIGTLDGLVVAVAVVVVVVQVMVVLVAVIEVVVVLVGRMVVLVGVVVSRVVHRGGHGGH